MNFNLSNELNIEINDIKNNEVNKNYLACVEGKVKNTVGTLKDYLKKNEK